MVASTSLARSAAAEPGETALDHPTPGQQLKAFDASRPLDDFDRPRAAIGDGILQLGAAIDAIGEDVLQLGKAAPQIAQQRHRAMRILNVASCTRTASRKPWVSVMMWR